MAVARAWADAVRDYAAAVVPPSAAVTAAADALAASLAAAFVAPNAIPGMEAAFTTFAAAVGAGMAPAFVAVPPAGPVGFAAHFAGPAPQTNAAAAALLAGLIDTWLRTGASSPASGGAAVLWS